MKKFINLAVLFFVGSTFGAERNNNNLNEFPRRRLPFNHIAGQNREQNDLVRQEAVRRGMNEEQIAILLAEIERGDGVPGWFLRGELGPDPRFVLNIPDHINNHLLPRDPRIVLVQRNVRAIELFPLDLGEEMQALNVNHNNDEDLAQRLPQEDQHQQDDMDIDDQPMR